MYAYGRDKLSVAELHKTCDGYPEKGAKNGVRGGALDVARFLGLYLR